MVASPGATFVPLECAPMLPPRPWCARVLAAFLLALGAAGPAAADGAWSFDSAQKLYGVKKLRAEDVVVPAVVVDETFELPRGVGDGPELEIKSYEVVGATLLAPSEIQATLRRYLGKKRYLSDVQAARAALQAKYEERGFRTVAVSLPKQTLLDGRIRIEVVEARLGAVTIENPGSTGTRSTASATRPRTCRPARWSGPRSSTRTSAARTGRRTGGDRSASLKQSCQQS